MYKKVLYSSIVLGLFGVLMVYSSSFVISKFRYGSSYRFLILQGSYLIISLLLMYIISKINYKKYEEKANKILLVCFLLLGLVLIPFIGVVRNGSRSWIKILFFTFQPSELSKIGLVIFTSKYLSKNNSIRNETKNFILPILLVIISFFALILLEPDFGSGAVIVLSLIILIFSSGVNYNIFIKLGFLGIIAVAILILIAPYRMSRIVSFLNPWSDPLGSGFQIIQSMYAIGPGGLLGFGFMNSRQKYFYLPEPQTDFIFSIISEEFGFLGILIVSSLFLILFINIIKISLKTEDLFGKYLSFGLSIMLIVQTLLNLSVVIGLIPVTGVTLPFISYGGSSLLISYISIGIILSVGKE